MTVAAEAPSVRSTLDVRRVGFGDGAIDFMAAWDEQRRIHSSVIEGASRGTVLLMEHPPVFTAGRRTELLERPFDGTPVIDVDRGGKVTWHGPGQLVGYPIVRLPSPLAVVDHVRRIESMLMGVCADLGVRTAQVTGRSGVWIAADDRGPERKVAAIGVRVAQGVTMHGFALNCDCDLAWFDRIVPCGISDAGVTSLTRELGRTVTVHEVLPIVESRIEELVTW